LDKAEKKNFDLWPIFDWQTWYTRVLFPSYDLEVKGMIDWQRQRLNWMDTQLSQ
jgi:hypothetical protein